MSLVDSFSIPQRKGTFLYCGRILIGSYGLVKLQLVINNLTHILLHSVEMHFFLLANTVVFYDLENAWLDSCDDLAKATA